MKLKLKWDRNGNIKKDLSKHFNFMVTSYAFCVGKHIWMSVFLNPTNTAVSCGSA